MGTYVTASLKMRAGETRAILRIGINASGSNQLKQVNKEVIKLTMMKTDLIWLYLSPQSMAQILGNPFGLKVSAFWKHNKKLTSLELKEVH